MWYSMSDSTKHYPLSIETVKKIKAQNKEGIKPEALETVEIVSGKPKEAEPEFVDVVGQISLKSLDKNSRKHNKDYRSKSNTKNTSFSDTKPPSQKQQKQRPPKNQNKPLRGNDNRNRPPKNDS
jgi:hypothetical protein